MNKSKVIGYLSSLKLLNNYKITIDEDNNMYVDGVKLGLQYTTGEQAIRILPKELQEDSEACMLNLLGIEVVKAVKHLKDKRGELN